MFSLTLLCRNTWHQREFLTRLRIVFGTWSEKLHGLDSKLCPLEGRNAAFSFFVWFFFCFLLYIILSEKVGSLCLYIYIHADREICRHVCRFVWYGKVRACRDGYRIDGGNNRSESEREKLINRNKTNEIILISSINRSVFSTQINTKRWTKNSTIRLQLSHLYTLKHVRLLTARTSTWQLSAREVGVPGWRKFIKGHQKVSKSAELPYLLVVCVLSRNILIF